MLDVINTIIPIFVVILLGWFLCRRNLLPFHIVGPLNKLVYYMAIPALLFRTVATKSILASFDNLMLAGTLVPVLVVFFMAVYLGRILSVPKEDRGTFMQSSFHGNVGYIALAVSYYLLDQEGFTQTTILAGFLILLQNFLSIVGLQVVSHGGASLGNSLVVLKKIVKNPVIISILAGISYSLLRIPMPMPLDRVLEIISSIAMPLALLIIGASLSFGLLREHLRSAIGAGFLKLGVLPFLGVSIFFAFGLEGKDFMPGLILLATPTATVTYIMAGELDGSTDLATATVSMNTIISAFTYIIWLGIFFNGI